MITVNAMGDNCPIPVIKTKKAMQELQGPETIDVYKRQLWCYNRSDCSFYQCMEKTQ